MPATRPGFVLPMALLLLALMTAGAVAVLSLGTAEVRVLDNDRAQTSAFATAEAGLQQYLARGRITLGDTTFVFPGGRALVHAMLMRPAATPDDTALYVIRSEGFTAGTSTIPEGRRTVAQLAYFLPGRFRARAAWTSYSGLDKQSGAGVISGNDACPTDGTDNIAGVSLPTGTLFGGESSLHGSPAVDDSRTLFEMVNGANIDWAGISDPFAPALAPDVIVCGDSPGFVIGAPCGSFPTSWDDPDYWPVILVNGSYSLRSNGRGTLIVTGNLNFGGPARWDGIVLVGGVIKDSGNGTIAGAVVSGLDELEGRSLGPSSKGGARNYIYDSCQVQRAVERHSRLAQIPNAWVDNWTAW
jgi:hypothetical protein